MPAFYVTDTHALIWYLNGSQRLGAQARAAFDSASAGASQIVVPVIVFAEIVFLAERRRPPPSTYRG
jgi:predicted nucleic acid-binding protein